MSTVRVSPGDITFEVEAGETVFDAALRAGWGWPTTCYGQAQCTRCHMKVVAGDSLLAEPDAPERAISERLARIAYRKEPDVVLYQSPILHRPVLHRILVIQDGVYYFKGDHNDFVDPGYVTRDELLGKLWTHVPKVGIGLSFIGKPAHAGVLAGLAVFALMLGGPKPSSRRRRRRRNA